MVKDGTSILIGGLSKEEKSVDSQETPILSKIPWIGNAFKSRVADTTRIELMVLVTPHIISGDELTTGYDRDFSHRLDKEYQDYSPISEEKPQLELKTYQNYPALKEPESISGFKPAREF
jgi:type II secretory pathway component GspD/PulD (secretin)